NLTALQRIVFTRRAMRDAALVSLALMGLCAIATSAPAQTPAADTVTPETERAWARAVEALQNGDPGPVIHELAGETARRGIIGDSRRCLLADALARRGDFAGARAAAQGIAERYPDSRLAPASLVLAATLAARAGDDAGEQALLKRLFEAYPNSAEIPEA